MSGHGHDHPHRHAPEEEHGHPHDHEAGRAPDGGPVVVDIGEDVGALIVRIDHEQLGRELHVRQEGWEHTVHTGIWDRPLGDHQVTVAVYPSLVEGTYEVLLDADGEPPRRVRVEGGKVTETDLRGAGIPRR